jgi:GTP:adenosylcobinamide-phosphate guanylyltransferase
MDALVTAGGIPAPGEPLYEATRGGCKAMLAIAGKPMIQWVIDALAGSAKVDRIVISGLPEDCALDYHARPVQLLPNQGGMLENIRAGVQKVLELNPGARQVLAVSSDIPGITTEMVDWTIDTALQTDHDVYYLVIPRQVMEARYPGSKRSYTRLKDVEVCGGDMNVISASTVTRHEQVWQRLIAARKNVFKQAALIGYDTLFLLLLRLITLEGAVQLASKRLKIKGRAVVCPYAEIGMDVDKPHQLELMRADLTQRVTSGAA